MITLQGEVGNYITLKNNQYSYFAGNNYLGLANNPEIVANVMHSWRKIVLSPLQ